VASGITTVDTNVATVADLLRRLGDIPAERVRMDPPPGTATEQHVLRLLAARDKRICELVDGALVEKPMGTWESILAEDITVHLGSYVKKHKLGKLLGEAGIVQLFPGLVRAADVGFVSRARLRKHKPLKESIAPLVPDLAIEILSRGNTAGEMKRKLKEYFKAGVRLVWIIHPRKLTADVYTSPTKKTRIGKEGVLDGGNVVPGYQLSLKELFEGLEE
jgi:Uma2 family endonuclease